ncbi:MAG: DUF3617 family protein [Sphingomicrobium sp.]
MIRRLSSRALLAVIALIGAGMAAAMASGSPGLPRAMTPALPGLWDVSHSADGKNAERVCLPDPSMLAQWEHRSGRCTRVVIEDSGTKAVIQYTCADGGFGRSDLTLLTPRTLRIATQGISQSYPFAYTLHARRVGDCPTH